MERGWASLWAPSWGVWARRGSILGMRAHFDHGMTSFGQALSPSPVYSLLSCPSFPA